MVATRHCQENVPAALSTLTSAQKSMCSCSRRSEALTNGCYGMAPMTTVDMRTTESKPNFLNRSILFSLTNAGRRDAEEPNVSLSDSQEATTLEDVRQEKKEGKKKKALLDADSPSLSIMDIIPEDQKDDLLKNGYSSLPFLKYSAVVIDS
jgi:hypothetical protein